MYDAEESKGNLDREGYLLPGCGDTVFKYFRTRQNNLYVQGSPNTNSTDFFLKKNMLRRPKNLTAEKNEQNYLRIF